MLHSTMSWAQGSTDPVRSARIRFGPLGITPSLSVSSGVDTNVFNEEIDPKSDLTTAINPRAQVWFRMRRFLAEVQNSTDAVSFKEYSGQGGFSTRNDVRLELPINRVRLSLVDSFANTRQRASLEIDTRVRRQENTLTAGADVRATTKIFVRLTATRATTAFDDTASYLGINLAETLNRHAEMGTLSLRYQLTGMTTLILAAEEMREQFEKSPQRDSRSVRVAPGVEFGPRALISGRASVGYRRFTITSGIAPDFTGPVASVELASTIRGATRVAAQATRDVIYSFEMANPYYVLIAGGGSITQRIADRWDVIGQASRQNFTYRTSTAQIGVTGVRTSGRTDSLFSYGGALSYHLSRSMRLGVTADHTRRDSGLALRDYQGTRVFGQFTYGS